MGCDCHIESAFRDLKSFVDVKPVHVWTPVHVKAHYTCCVLAHLINRTLTLRLHLCPGDLTRAIVAHPKLYQTLAECQINRIEVDQLGLATYSMTRPTPEQKELMQRLGLTKLLSSDIVKKARSTMQA
jgi:transposase